MSSNHPLFTIGYQRLVSQTQTVLGKLNNYLDIKIKEAEANEGIDKDQIIMSIKSQPKLITQEIQKLLEEGIIYEPRPGRVRYLG